MKRWTLLLPVVFVPFVLAYVLRLVLGGVTAGCTSVISQLRFAAMPFAYALKRAKGFRRIHGAWVKPREPNRRAGR